MNLKKVLTMNIELKSNLDYYINYLIKNLNFLFLYYIFFEVQTLKM